MDTQTQVERLIELAIIQRAELKQLVDQLPQLREHLSAEVERTFEQAEPQIRSELEEFVTKQAEDKTTKLGSLLEAKIGELAKTLQDSAQAKYSALIAERDRNNDLLAQAERKIATAASELGANVKQIVLAELDRFPRAGEIDRLRKEFAEPRGLNPRGKWSSSETYQKLDLVSYNGDSFVSSINDNRERPSRNSDAWTLSAARGLGGTGGGLSLKDQYGGGDYGQLLIGNGGDYSRNTLTAGAGITIDNGSGSITISAAGGGGQTLTATVYNAESVAITKGQVVYVYQANGNKPSVKLASNTAESTSSKTFGVVSDTSIAAGATGTVMCQGEVSGLNLGSYTEGATVYLDSTAGQFTQTKPSAPNHLVYVGYVTRANAGSGILYVKVQNGYELEELHNVAITTSVSAGSTLLYDATNSLWKNGTLTAGTNIAITNADASATVSVTGTIAVANGGTGASTAANARTNLGVTATGFDTTYAYRANNLSDLASASTARTNLGLGSIATQSASAVALTGGSASNLKVLELIEDGTVSATAATGSLNYDVKTQTVLYYTTNASGNWTLNIRGDSGTTLDSLLAVGDSITLAFLVTQGATAYYCTAITIDGAANTPKWQGGTAPTAGNASGIDSYSYTVIKTASATFTVLAAQTQFK